MKFTLFIAFALAAVLMLAGCASQPQAPGFPPAPPGGALNNATQENVTGLANPASVYCKSKNYTVKIEQGAGGETGYCVFPGGAKCDEWAFYRGECSDIVNFELLESPGYVMNPRSIKYTFMASGLLSIETKNLRDSNNTQLIARLNASDFNSFIEWMNASWFDSLQEEYHGCNGGKDIYSCPTDAGYYTLTLTHYHGAKKVGIYSPADRPEKLDALIARFKAIVQNATFEDVTTYPMTEELCKSSRGSWNECASACRGAPEGTACTMQCVQQCECGGIAGFSCPSGYVCSDYLPKDAADAMGVCRLPSR